MGLHLYIYNYGIPQAGIDFVLSTNGRLRDIYIKNGNPPNELAHILVICNIIATAVNRSLTEGAYSISENVKGPAVVPSIRTYDQKSRTIKNLWTIYKNRTAKNQLSNFELPEFKEVTPFNTNFAYCGIPHKISDKFWSLRIFTDSFDKHTWLVLAFLIILTGIILSIYASSIIGVFLTLSVLLSAGPSGIKSGKKLQQNFFLVIWMLCSTILINYYTGDVTSLLITPPEDQIIENITEIYRQNYTFAMQYGYILTLFNETYQETAVAEQTYDTPARKALREMYRKAVVIEGTEFFKALASPGKYCALHYEVGALKIANTANEYIAEEYKKNPKLRRRAKKKCYVGRKIFSNGELYYGFLPPGSKQLAKLFQFIAESGIYDRWADEYNGIQSSIRVQDRNKVLSPVEFLKDVEDTVKPLHIDGRVGKVFLIWGLCLPVCIIVFLLEKLVYLSE